MKKLLAGLGVVLIVGIILGYGVGWLFQQKQEDGIQAPAPVEQTLPAREVTLYFAEPQGRYLVPQQHSIPGCTDDRDCVNSLLVALIAGPKADAVAVLPETTKILGIELEDDLARLNFSRQLVDHHPGGSLSELLTVHSLINSLSESFPYVRQLQILIDGETRESLKGHVRIDLPVTVDYAFTQPSVTGSEQPAATSAQEEQDAIEEIIRRAVEMEEEEP